MTAVLEPRLRGLVAEATGNAAADGDPLRGGLDSVAMVRLLAGLEESFGVTIPPSEIAPENFTSLEALAALVRRLAR